MAKKAVKQVEPKVDYQAQLAAKIQAKVKARQLAGAVVASSASIKQVKDMPAYAQRVFLEELAKSVGFDWEGMLDETRLVMSDAEAKAFSNEPMGFGSHASEKRKDVPSDYLDWLADASAKYLRWFRWWTNNQPR